MNITLSTGPLSGSNSYQLQLITATPVEQFEDKCNESNVKHIKLYEIVGPWRVDPCLWRWLCSGTTTLLLYIGTTGTSISVNLPVKNRPCQLHYWRDGQRRWKEKKWKWVKVRRKERGANGGRKVGLKSEIVCKTKRESEKQQGKSVWRANSQISTLLWLATGGNLLMRDIL